MAAKKQPASHSARQARAQPRALTTRELLAAASDLRERLVAHVESFDAGRASAMNDIAGVLRTLVCPGRGDDVLVRLARATNKPLPFIRHDSRVANNPKIIWSIGSIPQNSSIDPAKGSPLPEWRDEVAVLLTAASRRSKTTWSQFITEYANTRGVHASGTVPELLDAIAVFGTGGGSLAAYMLRAVAITVLLELGELLEDRQLIRWPIAGAGAEIFGITFEATTDGQVFLWVDQNVSLRAVDIELVRFDYKDRNIALLLTSDGRLQLRQQSASSSSAE